MAGTIRYTKAITVFFAVFVVFLLVLNVFVILQERENLFIEIDSATANELDIIGTFVTDPLLEQKFSEVEQFVLRWGENKQDIAEIKATSPAGFVLAQFRQALPGSKFRTYVRSVYFMDQHLLDLELVRSVRSVDLHLQEFAKLLVIQSLVVLSIFGAVLWFVMKYLALQPLEKEIKERIRAEHSIREAHTELQQIFNTAGDGMRIIDSDFNVLKVNRTFEMLAGLTEEDMVGRKCQCRILVTCRCKS